MPDKSLLSAQSIKSPYGVLLVDCVAMVGLVMDPDDGLEVRSPQS
jgi:hypothetical protein